MHSASRFPGSAKMKPTQQTDKAVRKDNRTEGNLAALFVLGFTSPEAGTTARNLGIVSVMDLGSVPFRAS